MKNRKMNKSYIEKYLYVKLTQFIYNFKVLFANKTHD